MHTLSCCVLRPASASRRSFGASAHASRLPWDLCESLTERACSVGQRSSSSSVCIGRWLWSSMSSATSKGSSAQMAARTRSSARGCEAHRLARATGAVHRPLPAAATLDVRRRLRGPSHRHRLPADLAGDYRDGFPNSCVLFPDAAQTLSCLRTSGVKLGLITNGSIRMQSRKLECLALVPLLTRF
jgi:hypothetical protein